MKIKAIGNKVNKNIDSLVRKSIFVFTLSVFLYFNLTFVAPSQIMIFSVAYATTENNNTDTDNESSSPPQDEQQPQQETEMDESNLNNDDDSGNTDNSNSDDSSSPSSPSEQINQCSAETVKEPSYIDESGCRVLCPTIDSQDNTIPEGCPTLPQTTSDQNPDNLIDSPQGLTFPNDKLLKLNSPMPNYGLKGFLTIKAYAVNFTKEQADRISICVDTQLESGEKTMASPHCTFGANKSFRYAVQPGQVVLSIKSDIGMCAHESPCQFSISLGESKSCTLNFVPLFEVPKSKTKFDLPKLTGGP
jgi:hypothetical protein